MCINFVSLSIMSDDTWTNFERILANDPTLTDVILCDIGPYGLHEIGKALESNTHLTSLNLVDLKVDYFQGMTDLLNSLAVNKHLIELSIENKFATPIYALETALAANNTLKRLSLSNTDIRYHIDGLAQGLAANTALTLLDLEHCALTDVDALASALKTNMTLSILWLGYNHITNIEPLATALETNTTLIHLDLTYNGITNIDALANVLSVNTTLKDLVLTHNSFVNASAFTTLAENQSLTYLDLGDCGIDDIAPLANALMTNNTLTDLSLRHNTLIDVTMLATVLKTNTALSWLSLLGNQITNIDSLATALVANTTLTTLYLDDNPIVDDSQLSNIASLLDRNNRLACATPAWLALTMAMHRQHVYLPPDLWGLFAYQFL